MKQNEKKNVPWEAVDPKPPVIQSGHMENRVRNDSEPPEPADTVTEL